MSAQQRLIGLRPIRAGLALLDQPLRRRIIATQARTPKASARFYSEVIRASGANL